VNVLDEIAVPEGPALPRAEWARFWRSADLPGTEALHASYVSHRYAAHLHDAWTIAVVENGAASFTLAGTRHVAPAGSAFLLPPGAVHTGESATPGGYQYRVLYLEPQRVADDGGPVLLAQPASVSAACRVVIRDADLASRLGQFHRLLRLPGHALEQGEALASVALAVSGIVSGGSPAQHRSQPKVMLAVEFIRANWREDFSLGDLSRATGASRYHLVRAFHREIGVTPSGYRRALRVAAARRLLRQGQRPGEVAATCGFYDQSHLNRHFKLAVGTTPGQYVRVQYTQ
jgi:AraC-like DNA-binding protein